MDGKLAKSLGYPREEALAYVERTLLFRAAPAAERRRMTGVLKGQPLPRTSMHGDFHFMNFVRHGGRVRLIHWEFFDPDGTFLLDYLDFRFQPEARALGLEAFVTGLEPTHPVLDSVAAALDIDPRRRCCATACTRCRG